MRSSNVTDLGGGVHRVTHPLPFALNHVHSYAIADGDGWTVVDAGPGMDAEARWRDALDQLGRPRVARIVITHYHPDHIGGAETLRQLTGAKEVLQSARDAEMSDRAWARPEKSDELRRYLLSHGMPGDVVEQSVSGERMLRFTPPRPTHHLEDGDTLELAGEPFRAVAVPGHADGHVALFGERTGRMFGGDSILQRITPNVSTWYDSEPDPLARYLDTLARIEELRPAVVYAGHFRELDGAAARAAEIREHHRVRLDVVEEALRAGATTPWEVSRAVWPEELTLHEQRFALLEALSHLVHLQGHGRALEHEPGRWRAASA